MTAAPGPQQPDEVPTGAELIAAERRRQVEQEGWTPEHDATHRDGRLALAAVCYALPEGLRQQFAGVPLLWPWASRWWKPRPDDRVRELVKAGALIAAEIDRLRTAAPSGHPEEVLTAARLAGWLNKHPELTGVTDGTQFVGTSPAQPVRDTGEGRR